MPLFRTTREHGHEVEEELVFGFVEQEPQQNVAAVAVVVVSVDVGCSLHCCLLLRSLSEKYGHTFAFLDDSFDEGAVARVVHVGR